MKKQPENKPKSDPGKDGGGDGNLKKGEKKKPYIYHHHKGCNRPANKRMFSHDPISAAEEAKLPKPTREQPQPPAKGRKKTLWCEAFLSETGCTAKNCTLLHWTEDMVRTAEQAEAKAEKSKKQNGGVSLDCWLRRGLTPTVVLTPRRRKRSLAPRFLLQGQPAWQRLATGTSPTAA